MQLAPLNDELLGRHFAFLAPDGIEIFLLDGGQVRGSLLHGTRLVNQMRANHALGILETLILAHGYMAAGLLTAMMKGEDRIALGVQCSGPARGMSVESTAAGTIRGYLRRNPIPVAEPLESFDTAPFLGEGVLSITKYLHGAPRPYTGQVRLEPHGLAQNLARYFLVSEQMPTSFSLSVFFDTRGRALGAAGLFLQVFPGASGERMELIERRVRALPSLGKHFAYGGSAAELIYEELGEFSPSVVGRRDVRFSCPCSRERFRSVLSSLSGAEARSIREEGPFPLETVCHNCSSRYSFERDEVRAMLAQA